MTTLITRFAQTRPAQLILWVALTLVVMAHMSRFPLWLSVFCVLLLAWRLGHELRLFPLPNKWLRFLLVLLALSFIFSSYHTLIGRTAGTAMLVLMLCLKLMEMHTRRDEILVLFLGYFIVITGFLFSQSIFVGAYMLIVVLALTTALIALHHPLNNPEADKQAQRGHLRLAFKLLMQALPLAALLFVLFPRVPGPLWGLPDDAFGGVTGLSDSMSPGKIGRLSDNNAVAFRVTFKDAPPPASVRYWRGPVLWDFDGYRWTDPDRGQYRLPSLSYHGEGDPVDYTVTLQPHNQHWLFALDMPALLPPDAYLTPDLQLNSTRLVKNVMRYEMRSFTSYRVESEYYPDEQRYLALPMHSLPKTRKLATTFLAQARNDADVVKLALQYIIEQPFYYTRQPPLLFDDPVDEFLFDTRKGFCEHYASAFTALMRAAGIPARVVTGYQGGEMNPLENYMIVRQSDAHAWSEVWLKDRGWVRVDATAVIPPERIEHTDDLIHRQPGIALARGLMQKPWLQHIYYKLGFAWDALNFRWNRWVIGYNNNRQRGFFESLGLPDITWRGMTAILFATLSVVLGVLAFKAFNTKARSRDPINVIYTRFCHKLSRQGFIKPPYEGATHFARRVCRARPDLTSPVNKITRLYTQLRYALKTPNDGIGQLKRAVQIFNPR